MPYTDARLPEDAAHDYKETCAAIAEGLADMEAGRTVAFEDARAVWEAQKAARRHENPTPI